MVEIGKRYRVRTGTGHEVVIVRERIPPTSEYDVVERWQVYRERDGLLLPKFRREEDLLPLPARQRVYVTLTGLDSAGQERRWEGEIAVVEFEELVKTLKRSGRAV